MLGSAATLPLDPALVRKFMTAAADVATDAFRNAVRPIYGADSNGRPTHIGSSILIEIDGVKMIATAAHVIDHNVQTSLYVGGMGALNLLVGEFQTTIAPKGDRHRDHYDFAFVELSPDQIAELGEVRFVTEREMVPARTPVDKRLFTAIGYPNSKNKRFDANSKMLRGQLYQYSSLHRAEPALAAKLGVTDDDHLLITHHPYAADETGRKVRPIGPRGLSGGAMIEAVETSLAYFRGERSWTPRLAGITIERDSNRLIATRMHVVISAIRNRKGVSQSAPHTL